MSSATQTPEPYDLVVLGSGEGGKLTAWHYASTLGKRCAVIEDRWYGGSCPNVACMPSKNVLWTAKQLHHFRELAEKFGTGVKDPVDMRAVTKRKTDMVDGQVSIHKEMFEKNGVEMIWGRGKFVGPKVIETRGEDGEVRLVKGEVVVVCTGSRAVIPDVPGLKEAKPWTHVEILQAEGLPKHLIIIGGGYVGLEFAQAMRRFGSEVTVLQHSKQVLKNEDTDVAESIEQFLTDEGVNILTSFSTTSVSGENGHAVTVKGTHGTSGEQVEITGSHILCAAGRTPNNDNIGLDIAGVKLTKRGHIEVDESLCTSAPNVFATGDCAGSPLLTHMGFDDFRIVRDVLSGGNAKVATKFATERRKSSRQVPSTLFTDPEFAQVGLREHEAKAAGINYRLGKVPMAVFLRTYTMGAGATNGFAKVLVSETNDTILGFAAVGANAGELLPVVQLAMKKGLSYRDIGELIIVHPTFNEGLGNVMGAVPERKG